MTNKDIENEIRALKAICEQNEHPHTIRLFEHGWLSDDRYFIDMELCDLNLDDYIHGTRPEHMTEKLDNATFVRKDCPILETMRNVWTITGEVAAGLEFIHYQKQVHRDLKPQNSTSFLGQLLIFVVLYSFRSNCWKITDFGFTAEATSKRAHTTHLARGSASYRAPELLAEFPKYTNKVDIWALGCILYELVCHKRTFAGDWAVYLDKEEQWKNTISLHSLPNILQLHLLDHLSDLLSRDAANRPRASQVFAICHSYYMLLDPIVLQCIDPSPFVPLFPEWRRLIYSDAHTDDDRFAWILAEIERRGADVIPVKNALSAEIKRINGLPRPTHLTEIVPQSRMTSPKLRQVNLQNAASLKPHSRLIDGRRDGDSVQQAEQSQGLVTRIILPLRLGSTPKAKVQK